MNRYCRYCYWYSDFFCECLDCMDCTVFPDFPADNCKYFCELPALIVGPAAEDSNNQEDSDVLIF